MTKRQELQEFMKTNLAATMPDVFFMEKGELICKFDAIRIDFSHARPEATFIKNGGDILTLKLEELTPGGTITLEGFSAQMGVYLETN
jgi:hypothetical protein